MGRNPHFLKTGIFTYIYMGFRKLAQHSVADAYALNSEKAEKSWASSANDGHWSG